MLPRNGLLPTDDCNVNVSEASLGKVEGATCKAEVRFIRIAFNNVAPIVSRRVLRLSDVLLCIAGCMYVCVVGRG